MRKYELAFIVHPDLEETVDKVTEKVSGFIKKNGGAIINTDNWGKRKLAYPISKNDFGIYIFVKFEAEPKEIRNIEKNVLMSEEIIRHLLAAYEEVAVKIEKMEEKPAVEKVKKERKKEPETIEVEFEEKEKEEKPKEKVEKERMKELDKKLEELLGKEDK